MEPSLVPSPAPSFLKIGLLNNSATLNSSRRKALSIHDFHHYKINSLKLFAQSYLTGIEIQYQLLSEISENNFENFFVDSFQSPQKSTQNAKISTYNFHPDEEIIEISGRSGSYIDQLVIKTNRGKIIKVGGEGGGEFCHKAPMGYCFNLIRSCACRDFIDYLEVDLELSSVCRFKIFKTIEENRNDSVFKDFNLMEQKIAVDDELFRSRFDFEKNAKDDFTYKNMRKELKEVLGIDKLGFMRYYLKCHYLDKIHSSETKSFSEELLKTLKEIYKLLKYPRILFNERSEDNTPIKVEELLMKRPQPILKTHSIFENIFRLLIIVKSLLESPAPFASSFTHLKNLLLNIHDLYISFLITLTNLQMEKAEGSDATIEKIKNLLKPPIYVYGHHIGFYILPESMTRMILESSKNTFKVNQLLFRRINSQDIFYYERQILVHCLNRKLFGLPSLPSTVLGIRQFRTNKFDKPNESFFLLSLEPKSLENTKPLEALQYEEIMSLEDFSFTNHLIASTFSTPLESISASFNFDPKSRKLIRVPTWSDPSLEIKPTARENASLRNPLYYLEAQALLKPMSKEILEEMRNLPLEQLLVEFVAWIKLETCLISFEYFCDYSSSANLSSLETLEGKNRKKEPVYSLSEETLTFLFKRIVHNMAFIKDNCHLETIDILFHLNPVVSLCQEQLLRHFPELETRMKQISKFDFEVIFARSKIEIKKASRAKIRKYTENMKKISNIRGGAPIYRTVTNWLKHFPLNKMEKSKIENFLQEMLFCFPLINNQEIYSHWNQFMDWEALIPYIFKNPVIVDFLLDLPVDIKNFKFHTGSHFTNLFDRLTEESEKEISDLLVLEVYVKKAGFNPDEGYPFMMTPFERAIRNESHTLVQKLISLGAGTKANLDILQLYVIKFYDHDEYELLNTENIKKCIRFNIEKLLEIHPILKGKLVWELLKKKPANEEMENFKTFTSCDQEQIFIEKNNIEKSKEEPFSFILHFKHKNLTLDLMFDNEARFHGLHLAITSLMQRLFGPQACVIPTRFVRDSENNCFEVKEFFPYDKRVLDLSNNSLNPLNNLSFEDICERILMNIILFPGEVRPEDERMYIKNDGKIKLLPWDFSRHFLNYYISGEDPKYQKDFIKTISYLLCLDEMKLPISSELRARIIYLDLYKELDEWLHELSNLHWKLSTFRQGPCKREEDYVGVLLKQNMIFFSSFRFLKLQCLLHYRDKITLNEIFNEIDPDIFEIYQGLKGVTYNDRYQDLLQVANKNLEDFKYSEYGVYLQIKSRISREVMSLFKQEEFIGPEEALLEMRAIKEGFPKEKIAMSVLEFSKIQDFDHILFALRSFDFKDTKKELQEAWIEEGLIHGFEKQLHSYSEKAMSLKLKNMNFLTVQSLEKMPLLKQIRCLILQGCALSDEIILLLASECPLLESLDLSFNNSLKNFEENVKYFNIFSNLTQRPAVFFQSLKHLNLMSCEHLHTVNVQADLETICLQDCRKITSFRVETISFNHSLLYADFQGACNFPEKEFSKILATDTQEIKIDDKTCKGAFANVLKEFPTYPKIPANKSFKHPNIRIPAKLLDNVFAVLDRPENRHLWEFLSVKDMTEVELAKLCMEVNKNLPSKNITVKYLDISNNKGIVFGANISMMKTLTSGGLPNVEILDLSQMNFGNNIFLKLFGEWLKINKVLKKLILNEISIKNEDLSIILDAIGKKNSVIESLSIRNNGIRFIGFQALSSFLENNTSLKYLDLSYNFFEDKSIKILFKALTHNKAVLGLSLKTFGQKKIEDRNIPDIKEMVIQDELVDTICDALNNNRVLQEIDLRNHPISQQKADVLSKILQLSSNLNIIKLKNSNFPNVINLKKLTENKCLPESTSPQPNTCQFLLSNYLNQSNFSSKNRTTSNYLEKSQRNALPDTWVFGLGIDGGGMRGVIPAILISALSKHTKYQVHQIFDYVGGSSIGGILALASAGTLDGINPVCLAENLPEIFTTYGKDIFGKVKNKMDPLGIMANKYNETGLESVIKKYFKNSFLSETLTNVLVTSVKKNSNEMVIFDSRKAFLDPERDFFMRNVARATSAAPTFFPAAEFYNLVGSNFYSLLDGGVGKNDPAYFIFEEVKAIAENFGIPQKFSVISFGTGAIADQKIISQNAGVLEVKNLMNKIMDTPTELDQAIFKEKYGNVKYRRFQAMLKFGKNQDISLDNVDGEVVKVYKDAAYALAEEFLLEDYGEFQNQSLVDWLAENTARKKELI